MAQQAFCAGRGMTGNQSYPSLSDDGVHAQLADYFAQLRGAFAKACAQCGVSDIREDLAGCQLRIATAGRHLEDALRPALAHLPGDDGSEKAHFEILAWDEFESGVRLPPPPWSRPDPSGPVRFALPPGGEAFRIHAGENDNVFYMFSVEQQQAVLWTRDARMLPNYFHAAPCLTLMHWWSQARGLRLLHAGCVGTAAGAALLVGPSGSGKSTTALLCALAGLHYLGDDYCLAQAGPVPRVFCLFNSGKLHRDQMQNFPDLAARAIDPTSDSHEKPVIFMHQHFPERVVSSLPLRAVIAPRITGRTETRIFPISPAAALRALAPSTLFQLSRENAAPFRDMAALVRALPCYRLELGTRMEEIPPVILMVLDSLN